MTDGFIVSLTFRGRLLLLLYLDPGRGGRGTVENVVVFICFHWFCVSSGSCCWGFHGYGRGKEFMIDVVRRGKLLTAELNEWACQVDTPTDVIEILLNEKKK